MAFFIPDAQDYSMPTFSAPPSVFLPTSAPRHGQAKIDWRRISSDFFSHQVHAPSLLCLTSSAIFRLDRGPCGLLALTGRGRVQLEAKFSLRRRSKSRHFLFSNLPFLCRYLVWRRANHSLFAAVVKSVRVQSVVLI
jgi:hypothetical protein